MTPTAQPAEPQMAILHLSQPPERDGKQLDDQK